jgi:hypothetical protein
MIIDLSKKRPRRLYPECEEAMLLLNDGRNLPFLTAQYLICECSSALLLATRILQVAYLFRCIMLAVLSSFYRILVLLSVRTYNAELIGKYAFIQA